MLVFFVLLLGFCFCDHNNHIVPICSNVKYNEGEAITVWANTVGPMNNRQENYSFSKLPLCMGHGEKIQYHQSLAESLLGMEMVDLGLSFKFKKNIDKSYMCVQNVTEKDISKVLKAVDSDYIAQYFIDDLPVWGRIGSKEDQTIFTHRNFTIAFNGNRVIFFLFEIIEVELSMDNPVEIKNLTFLEFTYSLSWIGTNITFASRFDKYMKSSYLETKVISR